jgi:hypothetical protein
MTDTRRIDWLETRLKAGQIGRRKAKAKTRVWMDQTGCIHWIDQGPSGEGATVYGSRTLRRALDEAIARSEA